MGSTETKAKRSKRRSRSSAGDAFVVLAMTLTTVALAIGLYLQFRLAFWLAVVAALSVYVGLLALHVLVRRSERVEHLTAEIQRLEAELSQVAGAGHACGSGKTSSAGQTSDAGQPSSSGQPSSIGNTSSTGHSPNAVRPAAHGPGAMPVSGSPPQSTAASPVTGIGTVPSRATAPSPPVTASVNAPAPSASPQPAGNEMPPRDQKPRADAAPGRVPPPVPGAPAETAATADIADRPGMSGRAVDAIMNDYWAFRPTQPPRLPEPPPAGAGHGGVRPESDAQGVAHVGVPPFAPPASGRSAEVSPTDSRPRATNPPPVPSMPPSMPVPPRQSDVEMIGGLIKKMADEINAVEAGRLRSSGNSDRVPPAAIEASVNALRTTADQMRGSAASDPLRGSASDSVRGSAGDLVRGSAATLPDPIRTSAKAVEARQDITARPVPAPPAPNDAMRATAPPRMPPPLPDATPPARHAMDRPAARELPLHDTTGGLGGLPWQSASAASGPAVDAGYSEPSNAAMLGPSASPQPPSFGHSRLAALAEAITAGRLDVLLDPILGLADQRARHFEVSVRLRDKSGNVLEPPDGVPELRESGLLPLLDCARIQRSAQVAHRLADRGKPGSLFSAFSGESLAHDQFLSDFADLYAAREGLSAQLVLSFGQADVRAFANRDWDTIAEMHELGFRFALQSVTDLDFDLEALKAAGFDFVKLDASVFLDGMPASGGVVPAADICRHLAQLGMTLIVGRIDDEAQLARIFGFGVIYGQGQLFGGARPMKSEALAEAGHAAA